MNHTSQEMRRVVGVLFQNFHRLPVFPFSLYLCKKLHFSQEFEGSDGAHWHSHPQNSGMNCEAVITYQATISNIYLGNMSVDIIKGIFHVFLFLMINITVVWCMFVNTNWIISVII